MSLQHATTIQSFLLSAGALILVNAAYADPWENPISATAGTAAASEEKSAQTAPFQAPAHSTPQGLAPLANNSEELRSSSAYPLEQLRAIREQFEQIEECHSQCPDSEQTGSTTETNSAIWDRSQPGPGKDEDRDPPVDPKYPWIPNQGYCSSYKIRCVTPEEVARCTNGGNAGCNQKSCELFFPKAWCKQFGWSDGAEFCHGCFWEQFKGNEPKDLREAYLRCMVAHEGQHAVDGPKMKNCETEKNAHETQLQCLQGYLSSMCGSSNKFSTRDCVGLSMAICEVAGQKALQTCRCELNAPKQGKPCPECVSRCNEHRSCYDSILPDLRTWFPEVDFKDTHRKTCIAMEQVYCKRPL